MNQKLQLFSASTFVLSAENNSNLWSHGTVKLTLYPDITKYRTHQNINFTSMFHISNTQFKLAGTAFLEKCVETIKFSSHKLELKHNNETKFLKFHESSTSHHHIIQVFFSLSEITQYIFRFLKLES